jgi:hypothetical protein
MTLFQFLLVAHIAVFGVWFGTDLATFFLSRKVLDTDYGVDTRRVLAGSMLGVEVIARLALPTMLALGLCLSIEVGLLDVARSWQIPIALVAAAWVAMVWTIHRSGGGELGSRLAGFDLVVRSVICAVLWVVGLWSAFGQDGPFLGQWLGAKVTLFALIMTCGIAIRFMLRPFAPAFAELVSEGPTPEREATMAGSIRRARPLVVVIWVSLLSATALAVTQNVPWSA